MSMVTQQLEELVRSALDKLGEDPPASGIVFDRPKRKEHGDWATNVALVLSQGKGNPRSVAESILEHLPESDLVERVEIAGPGFLNFHLSPLWLHDVVRRAAHPGSGFGRSDIGAGRRANVEFVSSNPTGPLNVVSGRHAAVGGAIANLLEATGHAVTREYYINDAGRQARLFAESLAARYLQHFGRPAELPEEGYKGDYLVDLAAEIAKEYGDRIVSMTPKERNKALYEIGIERMLAQMRASLERFGTTFDVWTSERTLHGEPMEKGIDRLRDAGYVFERDGAVWFRSTDFGDDKDRVLIRASGEPTYLAADVAYLLDKFGRGFDDLIYLWGADHHGTVKRLKAVAQALGFDSERVEIYLVQIVTLLSGGKTVRASTRAGVIVPLDELVDEVGIEAARYTFLTRSIDAPLDFDIALAKEQAPENPVYYVQYAHARISSILRKAVDEGLKPDDESDLSRLNHEREDELMRKLAAYEEVVMEAARMRAPQKIARYVEELAAVFSAFYRDCRVISEDHSLSRSRLTLCLATRGVIASGLGLLGVAAPERM